jgi:hypothetical protein
MWVLLTEILMSLYITERLLTLLSTILSGQPYKPLGAPATLLRGEPPAMIRDNSIPEVEPMRSDLRPALILFHRVCL